MVSEKLLSFSRKPDEQNYSFAKEDHLFIDRHKSQAYAVVLLHFSPLWNSALESVSPMVEVVIRKRSFSSENANFFGVRDRNPTTRPVDVPIGASCAYSYASESFCGSWQQGSWVRSIEGTLCSQGTVRAQHTVQIVRPSRTGIHFCDVLIKLFVQVAQKFTSVTF